MSEKLEQAIMAIKAGDKEAGKQLLLELVESDPEDENAWLWLTQTGGPRAERIGYLQRVLEINPHNDIARRGLAQLQQKQTPAKKQAVPAEPPTGQRKFFLVVLVSLGLLGCFILGLALFFLYTVLQLGTEPPPQPVGRPPASPPAATAPALVADRPEDKVVPAASDLPLTPAEARPGHPDRLSAGLVAGQPAVAVCASRGQPPGYLSS
jgi:hypothetical protein